MKTREELEKAALALETHLRLRNFAEDWDAPGMEDYDKENT
jgi:hypothetical protein